MPTIAGMIPVGDTGEAMIIAEWHPDPEIIKQQMFKLANDLENMTAPLTAARAAFIYDTALHFETESDPYGRAWTPLEDNYLKRKIREGYTENILHRSGDLEDAATSESAWLIEEDSILFDTEVLPFYGPYHQTGTMDPMTQQVLSKIRTNQPLSAEEGHYEQVLGGRGHNLPQRQFIGADEDTIAEIEEIFIRWINDSVERDMPVVGGLGFGSNIRGTFSIIGFLPSGQPRLSTGQFGRK